MKKIEAYIKPHRLSAVVMALRKVKGFGGMSVMEVKGFGSRESISAPRTRIDDMLDFSPYTRIEIFCGDEAWEAIAEAISHNAHTGLRGDGKIYVSSIEGAFRIINGAKGEQAI